MPVAAGSGTTPDWTPALWDVADRVPGRTLVKGANGSNVEVMTFSASTRPSDTQVARLITAAVAWVTAVTGPAIDPTLHDLATATAATYTAASVELGYPERQSTNEKDAQALGATLLKQAEAMRKDLATRNDVLIGEEPAVFEIAPVWSFPPAAPDWLLF